MVSFGILSGLEPGKKLVDFWLSKLGSLTLNPKPHRGLRDKPHIKAGHGFEEV